MRIQFVQDIIDKLRRKVPYSFYIKNLGKKILSYEKIKDDIDTIILGSSHAQLGYRAKANEFNLGLSFQDLYYSYELYKKFCNPKLKKVILFYSVFSPGNQTIKTKFSKTCITHKIITSIDYQDKKVAKNKKLYNLEADYNCQFEKYKKKFHFDSNYRGNEIKYTTSFKSPVAQERANAHYKNNIRHNNQTDYVKKMLELANKNGINFLVVLSPATKAYRDCLPPSHELFAELFMLAKTNNINIINMYDTEIFKNSDFIDWDHLNLKGATKLTAEIKKHVGQALV